MMKKNLLSAVALLLSALLLLSGCGAVTDALDEHFPEDPTLQEDDQNTDPLPDREGRTYVVLLTTQLESNSALSTVSLLTFQTAKESIHWLEFPAALYIRSAGNTLEGSFQRAYQTELTNESGTGVSATNAGISAVRSLLETGLSIPIDYSINLDKEQFTALCATLQDIPMTLYESLGGLEAGEHILSAQDAISFLTYNQYSEPTEGQLAARRCLIAALRKRAVEMLDKEKLSLHAMEIRGEMTTDIPTKGGEDVFFLRRFLTAKNDDVTLTHISTQSVFYHNARYRVLSKENTRLQINEQMCVYKKDLSASQFDPSGVFWDPSSRVMQTVYSSAPMLPELYTLTAILEPKQEEPETLPDSSDAPSTGNAPASGEQ